MDESLHPVPDQEIMSKWQTLADLLAQLMDVPAALVMRLSEPHIEVFVSSQTEGNPYQPGDKEHFENSGLYCETVIKTNDRLWIPNALKDTDWKTNPDVELGMISYLGYPIVYPDGAPFGTICVLDRQGRTYDQVKEDVLLQFREMVQNQLALCVSLATVEKKNAELAKRLEEISELRELVPICSYCKNVRDDEGYWKRAESYIESITKARVSHGICPTCLAKHHPEYF